MNIETIDEKEYLQLLGESGIQIPVWSSEEALLCYQEKELVKVVKNNNPLALFLIPLDNGGVRRKFRYFPYLSPIILRKENNFKQKEIYKLLFSYIFKKYNYTFIPLHPDFKIISSIASQGGFVEMRHTHILKQKISFNDMNSKLRNHIRNATVNVDIAIDQDYTDFDFSLAIKGSYEEQNVRSSLAKKLIDDNKAFVIKAKNNGEVVAGLIILYDDEWAYLLHSYQKRKIRGVIPLMILRAEEISFDLKKVKYFDFEGSVIDDIDDFFSTFNVDIVTYPFVIYSKDEKVYQKLIKRSINIEGRIKKV